MRMLDLFSGKFGWSKSFALRRWECVGVDLVRPSEIPAGCDFINMDILGLESISEIAGPMFDFICASSPCEGFAVFGMPNFHPQPAYPDLAIKLFNHARALCEESGLPYVMENVRSAERFVGRAENHAGSFYLWGNAVPPLLPKGIVKGFTKAGGRYRVHERRSITPAEAATIPPELANSVCDYAERLIEQKAMAR